VKNTLQLARRIFRISAALLAFLVTFGYGIAAGRFELFPFAQLHPLWQALADYPTTLRIRPHYMLHPARYNGSGVTRFVKDKAAPGLTLLAGFFQDTNELRLIRNDGTVLRRWRVHLAAIFPDSSHVKPADSVHMGDWNVQIMGALALPDGSVVFNLDDVGMAKLDRCGAIQWTLRHVTHHSVEPAEDGGFWAPGKRYIEDRPQHPTLRPPYLDETILKISADGRILQETSILDVLFENHLQTYLFANRRPPVPLHGDEFTHLNDVEPLTREMAAQFPQFAPGDLLISLRYPHVIMVMDPKTNRVKWHKAGPWLGQHDPDFTPNGRISVFNNNSDGTETGALLGGSTILEIDPRTDEVVVKYGAGPGQKWFTNLQGQHQILPNGNLLITEAHGGRAFEVDERGDVVWEFINRYDADRVTIVTGATRYPDGYFTVTDWACR
jgi:hypothetical protein